MRCDVEEAIARLTAAGRSQWMYRDATGAVRVGAGLRVEDEAAAGKLLFQLGPRAATQTEIVREYWRVKDLPAGLPAWDYRGQNAPELEQSVVDALLRTCLVGLEDELRATVPGFNDLGEATRVALLEVALREDVGSAMRCAVSLARGRANEGTAVGRVGETGIVQELVYGLVGAGVTLLRSLRA